MKPSHRPGLFRKRRNNRSSAKLSKKLRCAGCLKLHHRSYQTSKAPLIEPLSPIPPIRSVKNSTENAMAQDMTGTPFQEKNAINQTNTDSKALASNTADKQLTEGKRSRFSDAPLNSPSVQNLAVGNSSSKKSLVSADKANHQHNLPMSSHSSEHKVNLPENIVLIASVDKMLEESPSQQPSQNYEAGLLSKELNQDAPSMLIASANKQSKASPTARDDQDKRQYSEEYETEPVKKVKKANDSLELDMIGGDDANIQPNHQNSDYF